MVPGWNENGFHAGRVAQPEQQLARARFFRTGTAWYDDVAVEIVRTLGLLPIGFDINADFGATASAKVVAANAQKAKPGSILIGHFNRPEGSTFEGLKVALPAMRAKGVRFARIEDVSIA